MPYKFNPISGQLDYYENAGTLPDGSVTTAKLGGDITAAGKALLDDADNAAQRTTLGLGGAATLNVGTTTGTVAAGDDSRLSNARTPTSHTHGNLTDDGKLGTTAGLPVVTTTDGAVTTLALGTAGQVLSVNSTADGLEFATGSSLTGTGSVENSALRADGTGGSALKNSGLVIEDAIVSVTGITGDAGTDVITAPGTAFANGQPIRFTALTGGSGLNTTTNYFVREVSGATFKVETSIGGGAINFTTNVTAGTLLTGHSVQTNVTLSENTTETNSALVLTPKGTGAFILGPKPDGTVTGGNARGANAVDLQTIRTLPNLVASGTTSVALGSSLQASALSAIAIGSNSVASGNFSRVFGASCIASAERGCALGTQAVADRYGMFAYSGFQFGGGTATGTSQRAIFVMGRVTTNNTPTELFLDNSATRLTIPSGKVLGLTINITGINSTGSAVAHYLRQYCLKNVAGTTSEVYAPVTIGSDNAAGTSIALSANDTNDALKVEVTGITSEIWRWVASVDAVEIAYGT